MCRLAHVGLSVVWKADPAAADAPAQMAQQVAAGQAQTNGKWVAAEAAFIVDDEAEGL